MSALTDLARGQPCMIRIPGVCSGNSDTVVACHYRAVEFKSGDGKPIDELCAWGCGRCHDVVDGRSHPPGTDKEFVRSLHMMGVLRTIDALAQLGYRLTLSGKVRRFD